MGFVYLLLFPILQGYSLTGEIKESSVMKLPSVGNRIHDSLDTSTQSD